MRISLTAAEPTRAKFASLMSSQMLHRQINVQRTPLPIETAFTRDDALGDMLVGDESHWNRYYFDYPPEWKTSDTGEPIVGVRSIWLLNNTRHIQFYLYIRKYAKVHFLSALRQNVERFRDSSMSNIHLRPPTDEEVDIAVLHMRDEYISKYTIRVDTTIGPDDKLDVIEEAIMKYFNTFVDAINKDITTDWLMSPNPKFHQVDIDIIHGTENRDIAFNQSYDNDRFTFSIYSPRNTNRYTTNYEGDKTLESFVDFCIAPYMPSEVIFSGRYDRNTFKLVEHPTPFIDGDTIFDDDFNDVFNVGNEPHQNSVDNIIRFHRTIEFKNLWDRHTCKVYASFANQSNHYYVGNSHVHFTPIKYYKLNARDNRFWIELYSGRKPNVPMRLPEGEGFVIEMQFMQNDKLLYV